MSEQAKQQCVAGSMLPAGYGLEGSTIDTVPTTKYSNQWNIHYYSYNGIIYHGHCCEADV